MLLMALEYLREYRTCFYISQMTAEDKANNRQLSRELVLNENVIGNVKRFKIIADRYRKRRKRFSLRFNLIAEIYNLEQVQ